MMKKGGEILLEGLLHNGVQDIFGYPGGSVIPLYDTLLKYPQLRHILVRHEQGAAFAANGYSRASGKVGVCLATSGPGATNLVTGVADAMMDSVPMIVITGQVFAHLIGTDAFQETDAIGIMMPVVKHSYEVTQAEDLAEVIQEAFHIASTGRPGPVHIDITKNAFLEQVEFDGFHDEINIPGYKPTIIPNAPQIKKAVEVIAESKRPIAIVGHGALISGASSEVIAFLEKADIPCVQTLLGLSTVYSGHPLDLGLLGMHGQVYANNAVHNADLIISIGSRFDDRITGRLKDFHRQAKIIHFDIDPAEVGKNVPAHIPVVGDLKKSIEAVLKLLPVFHHTAWKEQIEQWKEEFAIPKVHACHTERCINAMRAWDVIEALAEETDGDIVIVPDVGQHQMWVAQGFPYKKPYSHLYSGGLGSMGFSLPAAMGAAVACPEKEVWSISGDGGFQMNSQELMTIVQEKIPLKIGIFNNNFLGMVRQWQELFQDKAYSFVNMQNPDFVKLAEAYGIPAFRAETKKEAHEAIKKARAINGPALIEFKIAMEENVFPMVPQGASLGETRVE
ncbi:MAG: biosynthetic-type acetolactate synthase large subunit [Candidatus Peregrinibacteria bacterium]